MDDVLIGQDCRTGEQTNVVVGCVVGRIKQSS